MTHKLSVKQSKTIGEEIEKLKEKLTNKFKELEDNDPSGWKGFAIAALTILFGSTALYLFLSIPSQTEIDIKKLKRDFLSNRKIEKIIVDGYSQKAYIYTKDSNKSHYYIQLGTDLESFEKQIEAAEVALQLPETSIEYKWKYFDL